MRRVRAFTLTELMAVIGIMLVLMVATFGVFGVLTEQMGPDSAVSSIQAMLNGARDYAASSGALARVYFYIDPENINEGTAMKLQYLAGPTGGTQVWADVRGRKVVYLHSQLIACRRMPDTLPSPPQVATGSIPTDTDIANWKKYQRDLLDAVTNFALSSGKVKTNLSQFGVVFDPQGYLASNQNPTNDPTQGNETIYAMTVIQIGGAHVTQYSFYPLNATSGTRIIFE
jgi:hypothetical protein